MLELKKESHKKNNHKSSSCGLFCEFLFAAEFPANLSAKQYYLGSFLRFLWRNYLRIVRRKFSCGLGLFFAENSVGNFPEDSETRR
jgi:hypothetical protein